MQLETQKLPSFLALLYSQEREEIRISVSTDPEATLRAAQKKKSDPQIQIHNKPIELESKRLAYALREAGYDLLLDTKRTQLKPPQWVGNMSLRRTISLFVLLSEKEGILLEDEIEKLRK